VITEADVDVLRSGSRTRGLDPDAYDRVVGSTAARRIEAGDGITEDDLGEP
jgi:sialic acid synthase SpsE